MRGENPPIAENLPETPIRIDQLDGNLSISESDRSNTPTLSNILETVSDLLTVATYNFRSLFPKIENAKNDILNRGISVAFCCEIWEKSGNKRQAEKIE